MAPKGVCMYHKKQKRGTIPNSMFAPLDGGRSRFRFFVIASMCVVILFGSAFAYSIYFADVTMASDDLSDARLITPVLDSEIPKPQIQNQPLVKHPQNAPQTSQPQPIPAKVTQTVLNENVPISTSPPPEPAGAFFPDSQPVASGPPSGNSSVESPGGSNVGTGDASPPKVPETKPEPKPDPPKPAEPPKPPPVVSKGVINGFAKDLPKPTYPSVAKNLRIGGTVVVQVSLNEEGSVTSARAVSGHPFLRQAAEAAAKRAKFTPTFLSGEKVKVNGTINYNFMP